MLAVLALAGCQSLPRTGPNKSDIYEGSVQRQGDAFVVSVDDRVTRTTAVLPKLGFSAAFRGAGALSSDAIRPGDTLALTIWENVDDGLFATGGARATQLGGIQVDDGGFIFVPYAGRIKAAGNTPESIRQIISDKLAQQTPDPQVELQRTAGNGATVTLVGKIAGQGVHLIERPTTRLSGMLAAAGGLSIDPEAAEITVIRGRQRSTARFEDIFDNPRDDIALRNGDRILVQETVRSFTVLGAAGAQKIVPLERPTLSGVEAIALAGGLRSNAADPTGVFVLRNEAPEIAGPVLGRTDLSGAQRMVYVLDLTKPNGLFLAGDFLIRDGDLLYVTEAPFTQWDKAVSAMLGSLSDFNTASNVLP
ncbi:polysaccharide biosynthesis/export family protein [Pseudooceanicola sp. CBS1P-1]|uniref:Polysaccharide export protein n=1 Tax=Pseudooceanicola albus TaxID=2692189 RepID=A0A6L7FXS6_9RHOB|nr:polysaccharide biosynthesis/export family protein [Pseudooceanicola endophyticus]MXN16222.1 polysaccharide export protein [Pseudooceanicola albus]